MTYFSIKLCFIWGGRYILQLQKFYFSNDIISRSDVLVHLPSDTEWHWVPSAVWAPSTSGGGPSSRFYPSLWLAPREPEDSGCCQSPTCDERMLTMSWVSVLANRAGIRISSWHGCRAQAPVLVQILHGQTKSGVSETMEHFFQIFLKPEAESTAVVEASVGWSQCGSQGSELCATPRRPVLSCITILQTTIFPNNPHPLQDGGRVSAPIAKASSFSKSELSQWGKMVVFVYLEAASLQQR